MVRFAPATAGVKCASLRVTSDATGRIPADIVLTGEARAGAYWEWAFDMGIINQQQAWPDADLDGDGIDNRHEFAFGLSPLTASTRLLTLNGTTFARGLPFATLTGTPERLRFTFPRRINTAGLIYTVEFSDDASNWQLAANVPAVIATDGAFEALAVDDDTPPGGRSRRFVRLRVSVP